MYSIITNTGSGREKGKRQRRTETLTDAQHVVPKDKCTYEYKTDRGQEDDGGHHSDGFEHLHEYD
jgi:hypothetical protein